MKEYTAFVKNKNCDYAGTFITDTFNTKAEFARELRGNGFKVVRILEKDIYDFINREGCGDEIDFKLKKVPSNRDEYFQMRKIIEDKEWHKVISR